MQGSRKKHRGRIKSGFHIQGTDSLVQETYKNHTPNSTNAIEFLSKLYVVIASAVGVESLLMKAGALW